MNQKLTGHGLGQRDRIQLEMVVYFVLASWGSFNLCRGSWWPDTDITISHLQPRVQVFYGENWMMMMMMMMMMMNSGDVKKFRNRAMALVCLKRYPKLEVYGAAGTKLGFAQGGGGGLRYLQLSDLMAPQSTLVRKQRKCFAVWTLLIFYLLKGEKHWPTAWNVFFMSISGLTGLMGELGQSSQFSCSCLDTSSIWSVGSSTICLQVWTEVACG